MAQHKHAENMRLYYEDALETDRPWERWEYTANDGCGWFKLVNHPAWADTFEYRRKRQPLCTIEGREVFKGDVLYWKPEALEITAEALHAREPWIISVKGDYYCIENLTWTKPTTKRELWQWAYQIDNKWFMSGQYAGSEKEWREHSKMTTCKVRRLDHTRIEVSDE